MVEELLPEKGPVAAPQLTPIEQARAVPRLTAAQREATGKRAQRIAFLLAVMGSEYEKNRDFLVQAVRRCGARPVRKANPPERGNAPDPPDPATPANPPAPATAPDPATPANPPGTTAPATPPAPAIAPAAARPATGACDEDTPRFLILLYEGGHQELLTPLIAAGTTAAGAIGEVLGSFYYDLLTQGPEEFLTAIRTLGPQSQAHICSLAARRLAAAPVNEADELRRSLQEILGNLAQRCLHQLETAEPGR